MDPVTIGYIAYRIIKAVLKSGDDDSDDGDLDIF